MFEHVEHLDNVFKELVRVLKKNGLFIISTPFFFEEHEKPYDFRRYTSFGVKQLFITNGIEILEARKSTDYKTTIGFMHCMYYDNAYRRKKTFYNCFLRYISCIWANLCFLLRYKSTSIDDDIGINIFAVGKKI